MTTTWIRDAFGVDVQHRNNWSCCDDGFGNLIEAAGSYYKEHPTAPMLHKDMQIINTEGALYYWFDHAAWLNPPVKHNPHAATDFMYSLSMKGWPQHGYKLIHENGGEYWTQDYTCAKPDKIPANRRSKALLSEPSLLKNKMLSEESKKNMTVYDAKIVRGKIEEKWRELHAEWEKAASKCGELYREYLKGLGKAQTYDEWHEMAYKDHDAQMEKEVLIYMIEDIRVEWRKADDEVKRLEALNERTK